MRFNCRELREQSAEKVHNVVVQSRMKAAVRDGKRRRMQLKPSQQQERQCRILMIIPTLPLIWLCPYWQQACVEAGLEAILGLLTSKCVASRKMPWNLMWLAPCCEGVLKHYIPASQYCHCSRPSRYISEQKQVICLYKKAAARWLGALNVQETKPEFQHVYASPHAMALEWRQWAQNLWTE